VHLARARLAVDLAHRIVDRVAPLSDGAISLAVLSLYREAAFWALTADHDGPLPSTPAEALQCAGDEVLLGAGGNEAALANVREALARTFVASADLGQPQRRDEVRVLRAFVQRVTIAMEGPEPAKRRTASRRIALVVAAATLALLAVALLRTERDLAAHRPWRASSSAKHCDLPNNNCAGEPVDIFFHTNEEESPWVEIDLGKVETFSTVAIRNRLDCCMERAVPLAIEVSTDGSRYAEVARRDQPFGVWDAKFEPVRARYVRARALRRTILHLERITVR
jgi:F5/8 type C domain-containing protein